MLSAVVAVLCRAKQLVILSDINGLYDADPRLYPNAKLISRIEKIDETVYALAGGAGSRRGTGGMKTKLRAAALATAQGIDTVITNGKTPETLYEIIKGNTAGTLFMGRSSFPDSETSGKTEKKELGISSCLGRDGIYVRKALDKKNELFL